MPDVIVPTPDGTRMKAYLSPPASAEPRPGVVVIHDAFGLTRVAREHTDRLAGYGYLTLAPDLYARGGMRRCVRATMQSMRSGQGKAFDDIQASRQWLADRADCNGRVGIIGFCMGGGFALLSAPRYEFAAASVNYGEVPDDAVDRLEGACPIVASYGGRDLTLRGRAKRLEEALTELGVPHDIKEYPDAGHSFMNRINAGPVLGNALSITRFNYHHASSEDSWRRILDFFEAHLASEPGRSRGRARAPGRSRG
jgi:carboxymethylenebutenolidase